MQCDSSLRNTLGVGLWVGGLVCWFVGWWAGGRVGSLLLGGDRTVKNWRFGKTLEFVFFSILCFGFVDVEA